MDCKIYNIIGIDKLLSSLELSIGQFGPRWKKTLFSVFYTLSNGVRSFFGICCAHIII